MAVDFRTATDDLNHQEVAEALGCSLASVRQARLPETSKARRTPPPDWERPIAKLAKQKAEHFKRLANKLGAV
jgi:hypothetical protein